MKASGYNIMRDDSALLEEHDKSPPSFSVHLYPAHWTLNNGPKFLYNNQISSILEDIRAFRIPTDFIQILDDAGVPYYNGCLIVELLDYRPAKAKDPVLENPDVQRVVLRPSPETIWADICMLNAKAGSTWSDAEALDIEARLLLSTSTPLCLDPDPHLTRVVNSMLRVSTPNVPNSLKRKAAAMVDLEEDETEKAKRAKVMQYMNPQANTARKPFHPSYKVLALMEQRRANASQQPPNPQPVSVNMTQVTLPTNGTVPGHNGAIQTSNAPVPTVAPGITVQISQPNGVSQPTPVTAPHVNIPPHLQQVAAPLQRLSPVKQQQAVNASSPQRPPSQPVAPQVNPAVTQQAPVQSPQQSASFNPPMPPSNFLNPPPIAHRRMSVAKPGTPAIPNPPLPSQQSASQLQVQSQTQPQIQPQIQPQTQTQSQAQLQTQPQAPSQAQPHAQHQATAQTQPQPRLQSQPQPQPPTQQGHPAQQHPPNMQNLQMAQYFHQQTGRPLPMSNAQIAVAMAQRQAQAQAQVQAQAQAQSGRNTPANANNPRNSPAPPAANAVPSPMIPSAAAVMISGRNTPVAGRNTPGATSPQVARGGPLVSNQPVVARNVVTPNIAQQQVQQPLMPGGQPVMLQPGAQMNNIVLQRYQQEQMRAAYMRMQMAQAQANLQQGHASPASQQQQGQQPGAAQTQQPSQEQTNAAQSFANIQMAPQMYNYMQMNMTPQQAQHYLWPQRVMGRGIPQMTPQMQNGQQQPPMPPGISLQQIQGMGRAMPGSLQNR